MHHLLSAADLSLGQATAILDVAEEMHDVQSRPIKKLPALRGRTVGFDGRSPAQGGLRQVGPIPANRRKTVENQWNLTVLRLLAKKPAAR